MNHANTTSRTKTFSSVLICLILSFGCKPAATTTSTEQAAANSSESPSTSALAPTSNEQVASRPNAVAKAEPSQPTTTKAVADTVVIDDELNTVDWSSLVGQHVTVKGDLVVVDTYDLVRRGQIGVARERLFVPTDRIDPNDADPNENSSDGGSNVAAITDAQKFNDKARITIDDGPATQNIFPPTLFPNLGTTDATVRLGSLVHGVSGKLVKAGSKLLLIADQPLQWTPAKRPTRPDVGDATVTVASFNVLNYFTTIDDGKNNARGADSNSEFQRQEKKLVSAMLDLQADVVGLMELENNSDAENRLVEALNEAVGKNVFKGCGLPDGFGDAPGGQNAIRVGIIYRSDRVSPTGTVAMIDDEAFEIARTPIAQTFQPNDGGPPFTVISNHFKSKGSSKNASSDNKNKGDGQGAFNAGRRSQALAICEYIDSLKVDDQQPRVLVIGDLNAYRQEDPIDALRAKGLVDLHEQFAGKTSSGGHDSSYSYVYYGQSGSLDHAFASESLAADITGLATWHINADEPRFLDYNEEYNPSELFKPDPYRSSDHDPVLIGIR